MMATWKVLRLNRPGSLFKLQIRRLDWLGLVIRMHETRSVKKILEGKLEGRRGRGRPRLRWADVVEDGMRELGVRRWEGKY